MWFETRLTLLCFRICFTRTPARHGARRIPGLGCASLCPGACFGKVSPKRCNFASCAVGSRIFLFGGDHLQQALNDTFVLDLSCPRPEWKKMHMKSGMVQPPGRFGHTMRALDDKTLVHTKTIATANEGFALTADEIAWSQRVIEAHAAAEAEGKGVLLVDGKLVENLHAENAHRVFAIADAIAAMKQSSG